MQKSQSFEKVNSDLVIRSHIKGSKVKMCHIFKIFKMQLHLQIKSHGNVTHAYASRYLLQAWALLV